MTMKTLVLDFDGTLADTRAGIVKTVAATLEAMSLPPVSEDRIVPLIGLPLIETFVRAAGMSDIVQARRAVEVYRELFEDIAPDMISLFPEVKETLRELHRAGVTITVASSRGRDSLLSLERRLGIDKYITLTLGEDDVERKKPAPDMVLRILELTGTAAADTLVVGDTAFDIAMGRDAGCTTCGVTYGNQGREQLLAEGADHVTDHFGTVAEIMGK